MKTNLRQLLPAAFFAASAAFAQGPLTPPPGADPTIGPVNALTPSGVPQATMKTLHEVEPRIAIVAGAPGVTPEANGGFTITASGSYYLTANLIVATGSGVRISANDVALDLNGFTVASTSNAASGAGVTTTAYYRGLSIRHGNIRGATTRSGVAPVFSYVPGGFAAGVLDSPAGPPGSVYHTVIEDLEVRACGGVGLNVTGGEFRRCLADGCSQGGFSGATAIGCIASANGGDGFTADLARDCEALDNAGFGFTGGYGAANCTAYENLGGGINMKEVTACHAEGNRATGIIAGTVRDCVANYNIAGDGIRGDSVANCSATYNDGKGIVARTVTGSTVTNNSTIGIDLVNANFGGTAVNCTVLSNGSSGISTVGGVVSNSLASFNNFDGIYADGGKVTDCVAKGNGKRGIFADSGTVTGCLATNNGVAGTAANFDGGGISAQSGLVSGCHANFNYQNGIFAPGGFVTGCRAGANGGGWSAIFTSGGLGTNNF